MIAVTALDLPRDAKLRSVQLRKLPGTSIAIRCTSPKAYNASSGYDGGQSFVSVVLYFSSTSVENFTEPSFKISMRGAVPRIPIVPTGVSTFMSPVLAMAPAMKVNVPVVSLNSVEFEWPFGSYTKSSTSIRAFPETLNDVPSVNVMPRPPSEPVSIISPR